MSDMTPEKAQALLDGATPGPWEVDASDSSDVVVWAADSARIGNVGGLRFQGMTVVFDMDERNARLIAAAPDLARAYIAQAAELTRLRARIEAADRLAATMRIIAESSAAAGVRVVARAALSAYEGEKG